MKQSVTLECPHYQCIDLVKNGHSENGTQRSRCKQCRRSVQWDYRYKAWAPGTKEHITEHTLNGSGVRDISRNLGIAKHIVIAELKKTPSDVNVECIEQLSKTPSVEVELEVEIRTEADEFWSYVGDKSNQRWTWYALDRSSGRILAYQIGKRPDKMCARLLEKLSIFPIRWSYTDNRQRDSTSIQAFQHRIGKDNTWKIERTNLNFRTHLKRLHRKTICVSKSETIHDNVIGMYMNRHDYQGSYGKVT